jgi:hypothetical protein
VLHKASNGEPHDDCRGRSIIEQPRDPLHQSWHALAAPAFGRFPRRRTSRSLLRLCPRPRECLPEVVRVPRPRSIPWGAFDKSAPPAGVTLSPKPVEPLQAEDRHLPPFAVVDEAKSLCVPKIVQHE